MLSAEERRYEFLEKHQKADELVCDVITGNVLEAVYLTPEGRHQREQQAFFREVQRLQAERIDD